MADTKRKAGYVPMEFVADYLHVSHETVRRRIADGTLPAYRIGGRRTLRVRMEDVERLAVRVPVGVN